MGLTDKLDKLMKEKNINKAELARASGVPYTTIDGFYKKGAENAKLSTLKKLCAYFNCSLDFLADDSISTDSQPLTARFDVTEFTENELDEIKQFAEFVKSNRKNITIEPHFTDVQEALAYIKKETSLVAAFNGKTDKEDVILQMANAIYMDRTRE